MERLYRALERERLEILYFRKGGTYRLNGNEIPADLLSLQKDSYAYLDGINSRLSCLVGLRTKLLVLPQATGVLVENLNALDVDVFYQALTSFKNHVGEPLESDFKTQCEQQLESYFKPFDALEKSLSAFIREQDAALQVARESRERLVRRNLALSALALTGLAGGAS